MPSGRPSALPAGANSAQSICHVGSTFYTGYNVSDAGGILYTATVEEIPYAVLHKIVARITAEVEGINRVLYDLTPKPTGTIEWE